jgi:uncharacterized protein YkwD
MSDRRGRGVSNRYKPDATVESGGADNARWRLIVFLVIVAGVFGYGGYAAMTAEPFDADVAEAAAIEHVNNAREAEGLARIEPTTRLSEYATEWSAEMAATEFRHGEPLCTPGGENIAYRESAGLSSEAVGTEIAEQWLNSPEHRKNIMDNRWDSQAVGVVERDGAVYATQQFC